MSGKSNTEGKRSSVRGIEIEHTAGPRLGCDPSAGTHVPLSIDPGRSFQALRASSDFTGVRGLGTLSEEISVLPTGNNSINKDKMPLARACHMQLEGVLSPACSERREEVESVIRCHCCTIY